ncbi:MAG: KpsF/GutQ family sugar-phosphate isomerase [Planctomycetota bacterium]
MNTQPARIPPTRWSSFEQLREAQKVLIAESRAISAVSQRLGEDFAVAANLLYECQGAIIVAGIGKAGLIGQKIAATLASTGTPAHFLHPTEALHGDLGRVRAGDVALVLSQSGETDEIVRLLPSLHRAGATIVAITASAASALGKAAAAVIELGEVPEAGELGLAPTSSAAAMLAVGDALAIVTSQMRQFRREDFARFHPGGSLGLKLSKVDDLMRPLTQCRVAGEDRTVREVLAASPTSGRRSGATMLLDADGRLSGIFTDSDLARLFARHLEGELDAPICHVMTRNPLRVPTGSLLADAVTILSERKISELPVVDGGGRPVGLIDITDVFPLLPKEDCDQPQPDLHAGAPACRVFREPDDAGAA